MCKLLVFLLSSSFLVENVYSVSVTGMVEVLQEIRERFGPSCDFHVIGGDGEQAAVQHLESQGIHMDFTPIFQLQDVKKLTGRLRRGRV